MALRDQWDGPAGLTQGISDPNLRRIVESMIFEIRRLRQDADQQFDLQASRTVLILDGSLSEPGLAFLDDTDTGLFREASAGAFGIANDGVEWVMFDHTGGNYHAAVDVIADLTDGAVVGYGTLLVVSGSLDLDSTGGFEAHALSVAPSITTGIDTADRISSARFAEPDITAGAGGVSVATTVLIDSVPTEGTSANHALWIAADNGTLGFGAGAGGISGGADATITYDGTNLVIDPRVVGSGFMEVNGDIRVVGHTNNAAIDLQTNDGSQRWRFDAVQSTGTFIFRDATAATFPFVIEPGAANNTLRADSNGGVVIGGPTGVGGAGDLRVTGDLQVDGNFVGGTTGMIVMWGAAAAPTGWLLCDGSAVSRTTYSDLFTVIGTTYGAGNGSTTFNVPDLRQRFPMGKAASGTGSTLGGTGGTIDHTHTSAAHSHADGSLAVASHTHGAGSYAAASHSHDAGTLEADSHNHAMGGREVTPTGVEVQSGTGVTVADDSPRPTITLGENTSLETAGVSGDTGSAAPSVAGTSGATAPDVTGSTASTTPGATGSNNPPFQTFQFIVKT